jgi:hypothetical protein
MSIGLPPAPQKVVDDSLDVVNAMRTIRHHVVNASGAVLPVQGGIVQRTVQGVATFIRSETGLTVAYEPDRTVAAGFEPVVFRLSRDGFPGSPIWNVDEEKIVDTFAELSAPLIENAKVIGYQIDPQDGQAFVVIEADADEKATEIEDLVEDLSNGTDVAAGGAWTIRRRWSAFGADTLVEAVGPDEVVYRVPGEDDPSPGRRQAGFRIRLMERFIGKLPPVVMLVRSADGTYDMMPFSLTRRQPAPADADAVRRRAVQAFHRLTTLESESAT